MFYISVLSLQGLHPKLPLGINKAELSNWQSWQVPLWDPKASDFLCFSKFVFMYLILNLIDSTVCTMVPKNYGSYCLLKGWRSQLHYRLLGGWANRSTRVTLNTGPHRGFAWPWVKVFLSCGYMRMSLFGSCLNL